MHLVQKHYILWAFIVMIEIKLFQVDILIFVSFLILSVYDMVITMSGECHVISCRILM